MICRLTITTGDGRTAEGAQFTSGLIAIDWGLPDPRPEVWVSLDRLGAERPGWDITWVDAPAADSAGGEVISDG